MLYRSIADAYKEFNDSETFLKGNVLHSTNNSIMEF